MIQPNQPREHIRKEAETLPFWDDLSEMHQDTLIFFVEAALADQKAKLGKKVDDLIIKFLAGS